MGSVIDDLLEREPQDPVAQEFTALCEGKFTPPDDSLEPVFIGRKIDGPFLRDVLRIKERRDQNEISEMYANTWGFFVEGEDRARLLSKTLTRDSFRGAMRWRPVVLTFTDPALEKHLAGGCTSVSTVPFWREENGQIKVLIHSLEDFRQVYKPVASIRTGLVDDMPEECLDGWLGEVCRERMADFPRAYAWLALLAAASVLAKAQKGIRLNLFACLDGPRGSGKSSGFDRAFDLFSLTNSPTLMNLKSGSAEGMVQLIGNLEGAPRLVFVNELAHMMKKAAIENSTMAQVLNDAYYGDKQQFTLARGRRVDFNCRLTVTGGIVHEDFEKLFGAGTIGGFYDRFIFGQCPTGFDDYSWKPFEGEPVYIPATGDDLLVGTRQPVLVSVDCSVWIERDRWAKDLGLRKRVCEHAIRAAIICASFDGREVLRADDLGPALAFAQYQASLRERLQPNPGENTDAVLAYKIIEFLRTLPHAGTEVGQYIGRKELYHAINAYRFGPGAFERCLSALEDCDEIEIAKQGRKTLIRLAP